MFYVNTPEAGADSHSPSNQVTENLYAMSDDPACTPQGAIGGAPLGGEDSPPGEPEGSRRQRQRLREISWVWRLYR